MKTIEITPKNLKIWQKKFSKSPETMKNLELGHFIVVDDVMKTYTLVHKDNINNFLELAALYADHMMQSKGLN